MNFGRSVKECKWLGQRRVVSLNFIIQESNYIYFRYRNYFNNKHWFINLDHSNIYKFLTWNTPILLKQVLIHLRVNKIFSVMLKRGDMLIKMFYEWNKGITFWESILFVSSFLLSLPLVLASIYIIWLHFYRHPYQIIYLLIVI